MPLAESFAVTLTGTHARAGGSRHRARVYVSSSARDLGDARAAVIDAVSRSGCEALSMESYGADSRPPIDRCLLDVGSCDVYVGIVAWRYGSCPPGERRSFTHVEYEEAKRLRRQILLFHLDEDAPWPLRHVDPSQKDVRGLRSVQSRDHIVDYFHTVDQLSTGVRRALHRLCGEAALSVPALLPYIADRHAQRDRLVRAAKQHQLARSPSVIVVHGAAGQAHHKFVEFMQEQFLVNDLGVGVPIDTASVALRAAEFAQFDVITQRIALACCLEPIVDIAMLSDQLHGFKSITLLRFPVEIDVLRGRPHVRPIAQLVDYFSRWPQRAQTRVLPVVSAQYREPSGWGARLLWGGASADRTARAIEAIATSTTVSVVLLPELTNIEQTEVEVWAEQVEVRRLLGGLDPVPIIRRMFREHERSSNERTMPMEKLAMELEHLLRHQSAWQEAV